MVERIEGMPAGTSRVGREGDACSPGWRPARSRSTTTSTTSARPRAGSRA